MEKTIVSLMFIAVLGGVFSGCGEATPAVEDSLMPTTSEEIVVPEETTEDDVTVTIYKDGEYLVQGAYQSPAGPETVSVNFTLEGDVITAVEVTPNSTHEISMKMQTAFSEGVGAVVVGKKLSELEDLSAVNGSSLTPQGFNDAVEKLKASAEA